MQPAAQQVDRSWPATASQVKPWPSLVLRWHSGSHLLQQQQQLLQLQQPL
jgi:hypothetical protein